MGGGGGRSSSVWGGGEFIGLGGGGGGKLPLHPTPPGLIPGLCMHAQNVKHIADVDDIIPEFMCIQSCWVCFGG